MDWSQVWDFIQSSIIVIGGAFTSIYAFSKKFRSWVNNKLRSTDSFKELNDKQKTLETKEISLENACATRTKEINDTLKKLNETIDKLHEKMEKDTKSTLLTLKCQIIDICSRVSRYGGITQPDKELLCELYTEYVDVWKQNHYVKSEAQRVIQTAKIIKEYKDNMIEIVKSQV